MEYALELENSIQYLNSDQAIKSIKADPYWPKWDSSWWHMLLLYEMGATHLIPERLIKIYVNTLNKIPLKIFPIKPEDMPEGIDPYRESPCHCQLGNIYQVLSQWGLDVDKELPWIRPWFLRYQMADGGLNCDNEAYLVKDEIPSSMVGTIAVFESILLFTRRPFTDEESVFLNQGATFLMGRQLMYDVLRGLTVLLKWSKITEQVLPADSVRSVVTYLNQRFPDNKILIERKSYESVGTLMESSNGEWVWQKSATFFPLLNKVSQIGEESPFLTKKWLEAKSIIMERSELKDLLF